MLNGRRIDPETLASRIKAARGKAGITQVELARRTGIARITIARLEGAWKPGNQGPFLETILALGRALDTDLTSEPTR